MEDLQHVQLIHSLCTRWQQNTLTSSLCFCKSVSALHRRWRELAVVGVVVVVVGGRGDVCSCEDERNMTK